MNLYDWRRARLRAESNMVFGVLMVLAALLANPLSNGALTALESPVILVAIGVIGAAIYIATAQWRMRGAASVYGLGSVGTVLAVFAALGLLAADRTKELLVMLPQQRWLLLGLGVALVAMGVGLRQMYLAKELAQVEEEAVGTNVETPG